MNGKTFFAFVTGAIVGAAGAWVYFNKKYFGGSTDPVEEEQIDPPKAIRQPKKETIEDSVPDEDLKVNYQKLAKQYTTEEEDRSKEPYVINPDDYNDGTVPYHVVYSYFEDGVVTDEHENIVEDTDEAIGEDFVNYFGDTDLAYVRNEHRRCDYEILRMGCCYNEPPEEE
ncbi:MAG: hypothetical protein J6U54_08025 [Clostridiales bacterium]|nr:hypothetical protein [Clostridiales bacterium]